MDSDLRLAKRYLQPIYRFGQNPSPISPWTLLKKVWFGRWKTALSRKPVRVNKLRDDSHLWIKEKVIRVPTNQYLLGDLVIRTDFDV